MRRARSRIRNSWYKKRCLKNSGRNRPASTPGNNFQSETAWE